MLVFYVPAQILAVGSPENILGAFRLFPVKIIHQTVGDGIGVGADRFPCAGKTVRRGSGTGRRPIAWKLRFFLPRSQLCKAARPARRSFKNPLRFPGYLREDIQIRRMVVLVNGGVEIIFLPDLSGTCENPVFQYSGTAGS